MLDSMNTLCRVTLVAGLLWCATISFAEPPASQPAVNEEDSSVADPALRDELLARREEDQAVREQLMNAIRAAREAGEKPGLATTPIILEMKRIDAANRTWLVGVLDEKGWPTRSMVGEQAADAAWLLVQHADDDVELQERVLVMLTEAAEQGEASRQHVALLTDRVRINRGRPQLYGTQTRLMDGVQQIAPVEDVAGLDERRAAVGLPTMAEYLQLMATHTGADVLPPEGYEPSASTTTQPEE